MTDARREQRRRLGRRRRRGEGSEELDSDGVLSDEGGGRGGDDDLSDALSDIGDAAAFARKGADALTRLAATKTFMCHIHNIKLQSLERRRRDLILHFSVGVPDEDVSAESRPRRRPRRRRRATAPAAATAAARRRSA